MRGSVLVVGDNAIVAMDIEAEARKLGLSVAITRDPSAAIALAKATSFTVAFVDVHLREAFDGLDLARVLVRETQVQVVLITAHSPADLAGRMDGIVNLPVLSKPIECGAMLSLLQSIAARGTVA